MTPQFYDALLFASQAHHGQRRKSLDEPYIWHCIRVAAAASAWGLHPDAQTAALLHDVVEDTPVRLPELQARFRPRAVRLVDMLTKTWDDQSAPDATSEQMAIYYSRIASDPDAIALKMLDRIDNLADMRRGCSAHHLRWVRSYVTRTRAEFPRIVDCCDRYSLKAAFWDAVEETERLLVTN